MKRIYTILLLAIICGCTQKINPNFESTKEELVFAPPVVSKVKIPQANPESKSQVIESDTYPTEYAFKVYAKQHLGDFTTWSSADDLFTANGESVEYRPAKNGWTTATPYYWPKPTHKLSFQAFSPSSASGIIDEHGVKFTNYTVTTTRDGQPDLLYSERKVNLTKNSKEGQYYGVQLPFYHALTQVAFRFRLLEALPISHATFEEGDDYVLFKEVRLMNVKTKGSFSQNLEDNSVDNGSELEAWTGQDIIGSYDNVVLEEGVLVTNTSPVTEGIVPMLVIPQAFNEDIKLYVRYDEKVNGILVEDKESESNLNGLTFSEGGFNFIMGKRYVFDINYGTQKLYFHPSIITWTEVTPN